MPVSSQALRETESLRLEVWENSTSIGSGILGKERELNCPTADADKQTHGTARLPQERKLCSSLLPAVPYGFCVAAIIVEVYVRTCSMDRVNKKGETVQFSELIKRLQTLGENRRLLLRLVRFRQAGQGWAE